MRLVDMCVKPADQQACIDAPSAYDETPQSVLHYEHNCTGRESNLRRLSARARSLLEGTSRERRYSGILAHVYSAY